MNPKPVFTASSPNTQKEDLKIAFKILLQPWLWKNPWKKNTTAQIQQTFSKHFKTQQSFAYNTGRAALYSILNAIGTNSSHEIITQAYTCITVPTSIIWTGAKPVYSDINPATFNTTAEFIKGKISAKTRAVIIQHTFGAPAEIDKIKELIDRENTGRQPRAKIYLIENCSHSLGAKYKGTKIGEWGHAAFLSFGPDKVISCTQGGLATSKDLEILKKLNRKYTQLKPPSILAITITILNPIFRTLINRTYHLPDILPDKVDLAKPDIKRLSNAQSIILKTQFQKLHQYNKHRRNIAQIYNKLLPKKHCITSANHLFLRFPLQLNNPDKMATILKRHQIIPGNWYTGPVHPAMEDYEKFGYKTGSCPNAEKAGRQSINLPTHINITEMDAIRIGRIIKKRR